MHDLTIILPFLPPTVNHAYASNGRGGRVLSSEYRVFRERVAKEAHATAHGCGWRLPDGPLKLEIYLTYGDRKRTDIDNRVKTALDSIALALGFDDARIARIEVERVGIDKGRPLCELVLSAWEGRR